MSWTSGSIDSILRQAINIILSEIKKREKAVGKNEQEFKVS